MVQETTPRRKDHIEEVKTREIWTYPDGWHSRDRQPSQPLTPTKSSTRRNESYSEEDLSSYGRSTVRTRTQDVSEPGFEKRDRSQPSRTTEEVEWGINVNTTDTWDSRHIGTSYSTASTLEKNKDVGEKVNFRISTTFTTNEYKV